MLVGLLVQRFVEEVLLIESCRNIGKRIISVLENDVARIAVQDMQNVNPPKSYLRKYSRKPSLSNSILRLVFFSQGALIASRYTLYFENRLN
jgi:hypothetical protein